jgi:hypothetical protein
MLDVVITSFAEDVGENDRALRRINEIFAELLLPLWQFLIITGYGLSIHHGPRFFPFPTSI